MFCGKSPDVPIRDSSLLTSAKIVSNKFQTLSDTHPLFTRERACACGAANMTNVWVLEISKNIEWQNIFIIYFLMFPNSDWVWRRTFWELIGLLSRLMRKVTKSVLTSYQWKQSKNSHWSDCYSQIFRTVELHPCVSHRSKRLVLN